jgi:TIR domain
MPAVLQALRVFVSAAESGEDEALWQKLETQLAILRKQGLIEIWDKGDIAAGADRTHAADTRLEAADIILLLISPDFLASDFVGGVELKRALERHEARTALVVPVVLRPCLWQRAAFAKLQALPTDGEPVMSDKWPSQDAAFLVVAEGIARAVEEHLERRRAEVAARCSVYFACRLASAAVGF